MVLAIVDEAEEGLLRPSYAVIECTGRSTGSSLAFVCAVKDNKIVTSDAFSEENWDPRFQEEAETRTGEIALLRFKRTIQKPFGFVS